MPMKNDSMKFISCMILYMLMLCGSDKLILCVLMENTSNKWYTKVKFGQAH